MSTQQKIILITIIIVLILGGFLSSVYLSQRLNPAIPQGQSQNADSVLFTFEASQKNPAAGEIVTVALYAQAPAGTEIRSLAAYLAYSPSIEIVADGVSRSNQGLFNGWDYIKTKNNTTDSRIEILAAYKPLDANPNPEGFLTNTPALFATIKLRWLGGEPGVLQLITDPATSGAVNPDGNDVPLNPFSYNLTP